MDQVIEEFVTIIDDLNETIRVNSESSIKELKDFKTSTDEYIIYLENEVDQLRTEVERLKNIQKLTFRD